MANRQLYTWGQFERFLVVITAINVFPITPAYLKFLKNI